MTSAPLLVDYTPPTGGFVFDGDLARSSRPSFATLSRYVDTDNNVLFGHGLTQCADAVVVHGVPHRVDNNEARSLALQRAAQIGFSWSSAFPLVSTTLSAFITIT